MALKTRYLLDYYLLISLQGLCVTIDSSLIYQIIASKLDFHLNIAKLVVKIQRRLLSLIFLLAIDFEVILLECTALPLQEFQNIMLLLNRKKDTNFLGQY